MKIKETHIYFILMLVIFGLGTCKSQGFFEYATFYSSMNMNTSMVERQNFVATSKGYSETTPINEFDYNLVLGVRKVARMDFEQKLETFYYGNEKSIADKTTLSRFNGWEYLFNYSFIRHRSEKFNNSDFWLRYVSDKIIAKAQVKKDDMRDLSYKSFDLRYRINNGALDISFGGVIRRHNPYHINPIELIWENGESSFQQLAQSFGYNTNLVQGNQHWYNGSQLIATSNDEFYKHYFGSAIAQYNRNYLDSLGGQNELSFVVGLSYYYYKQNYWILTWANAMPLHKGLSEYSHQYTDSEIDLDLGFVAGCKITKNFGIFIEGTFIRFWEKEIFDCRFGFNYLIF